LEQQQFLKAFYAPKFPFRLQPSRGRPAQRNVRQGGTASPAVLFLETSNGSQGRKSAKLLPIFDWQRGGPTGFT
jgi:hypothetical protein